MTDTITLPREAVQKALEALECDVPHYMKDRGYPPITALRAALQRSGPLKKLTRLTEEMGLYPWQEKAQQQADAELPGPQSQAVEPRIEGYISRTGHGTYYRENITPELAELEHGGNKMWRPLITLQFHREAMQFEYMNGYEVAKHEYRDRIIELEEAIDKKDAALKACVETGTAVADADESGELTTELITELRAAITQAQEQLK